uniref:Abasic site processing protein HMCES n=1 Tax=Glossina brevipalpis TaxID=37001 RepID=A0A1A9WJL8_9MUSC
MCGRTCLTLEPNEILKACTYKAKSASNTDYNKREDVNDEKNCCGDVSGQYIQPEWRPEFNCGRKYTPSFNLAPSDVTPVLVSRDHFCDKIDAKAESGHCRLLMPMLWGLVPFWHKGDYRKHRLTTNNCRLESMLESKLYSNAFKRGQRCVVLCEGFYEWQTKSKSSERAVYLLYMPQKAKTLIYDRSTWNPEDVNLLKMAGLFDIWQDEQGDKIYSYSVITHESTKIMSWLHHRMPAILETEQQINDWLDFKHISNEKALAVLRPASTLEKYRVASLVHNARNKSNLCNMPIELVQSEKPHMNKLMLTWLSFRPTPYAYEGSEDNSKNHKRTSIIDDNESESESPSIKRRRVFLES